jgi:cell division ATPase FtsA
MEATKRIAQSLNIPVEQADVYAAALQAALEIKGKRRSIMRVANMIAAIIAKKSTTQYNENDVIYARDWIAHQPIRRYIVNGKTSQRVNSQGKTTVPEDSKVSKTVHKPKHRK